jgi:endo-alpha-1,4-polygalactosaminidase (GH114 family)
VSPYAPDWRALYMQRVRQIAATGIDGIYVDTPYWMTYYTGWEDTWARLRSKPFAVNQVSMRATI